MAPTETVAVVANDEHFSGETVDFSGKGLKLDKEEDGNRARHFTIVVHIRILFNFSKVYRGCDQSYQKADMFNS